jgi:hypothetical protein
LCRSALIQRLSRRLRWQRKPKGRPSQSGFGARQRPRFMRESGKLGHHPALGGPFSVSWPPVVRPTSGLPRLTGPRRSLRHGVEGRSFSFSWNPRTPPRWRGKRPALWFLFLCACGRTLHLFQLARARMRVVGGLILDDSQGRIFGIDYLLPSNRNIAKTQDHTSAGGKASKTHLWTEARK